MALSNEDLQNIIDVFDAYASEVNSHLGRKFNSINVILELTLSKIDAYYDFIEEKLNNIETAINNLDVNNNNENNYNVDLTDIVTEINNTENYLSTIYNPKLNQIIDILKDSCCYKESIYEVRYNYQLIFDDSEKYSHYPNLLSTGSTDWYNEDSVRYEIVDIERIDIFLSGTVENTEKEFRLINIETNKLLHFSFSSTDHKPVVNILVKKEKRLISEEDCDLAVLINEKFEDLQLGTNLNHIENKLDNLQNDFNNIGQIVSDFVVSIVNILSDYFYKFINKGN